MSFNCHKQALQIICTEQTQQLQIHHPAAVSILPQRAGSCHDHSGCLSAKSHQQVGVARGLPTFTGVAEAFFDHSAHASVFRVDSGFRILKVVLSAVLGRCITAWQICHGMTANTMHVFSAGSFVFCSTLCKTVHTSPYKRA